MNYFKHYQLLCSTRKTMNRQKGDSQYYEKHHILPKSLGGDNNDTNLVLLTSKEHYLAHLLLYNYYKNIGGESFRKMAFALVSMLGSNKHQQRQVLSSRQYSIAREAAIESKLGVKILDTVNYKQPKSENHRENIRLARIGTKRSEFTKNKISLNRSGVVPKHNSVRVNCPICNKEGQLSAMKRWHFDNCKKIAHAELA